MKIMHLISGGDVGGAKTHVLTLLQGLGRTENVRLVCFMEGPFTKEELFSADEILVTSTTKLCRSVDQIDSISVGGKNVALREYLTKKMFSKYTDYCQI